MTSTTTQFMSVYCGSPDQVARVRAGLRDYLKGCPVVEEAVLIASELAANAVTHSASRGQVFTVRAEVFPGYCWVEVEDYGGPWHCRLPYADGRPHGLDIVQALAGENWGVETSRGCRVVWARVEF